MMVVTSASIAEVRAQSNVIDAVELAMDKPSPKPADSLM